MSGIHISRFTVLYVVVLSMLAVTGYYMEVYKPKAAVLRAKSNHYFTTDLTFYDLPRITMNVKNAGSASSLRMDISLEVAKKDARRIEDFRSRITDSIVTYMNKQNVDKMRPPRDIVWLHKDLLDAVNATNQPVPVHDIIFRQMVIM